jgi:hypothetical protein
MGVHSVANLWRQLRTDSVSRGQAYRDHSIAVVRRNAAVVLARDVSSRLIVFTVVMLGIFIPFVMRSEAMKKLK